MQYNALHKFVRILDNIETELQWHIPHCFLRAEEWSEKICKNKTVKQIVQIVEVRIM